MDTKALYALKGATVGITSGKFGPNELLTREQLAAMMVKILTMYKELGFKEIERYDLARVI
ncbi:S-layer homology domain-containing protein [Fusibacter ferrireducens]|uniref:S-layer homology domain-containing protein n=1 Tax=Fusibacter ferrireducens TaxID=2785058 RepID=UPI00389945EF